MFMTLVYPIMVSIQYKDMLYLKIPLIYYYYLVEDLYQGISEDVSEQINLKKGIKSI